MRIFIAFFLATVAVVCLNFLGPFSQGAKAQTMMNGRIAFTSDSVIYTINADGTNQTQLTNNGSARFPAWSPDGTKIAFSRSTLQVSAFDIYVMNADGSNQTRITTDPANDSQPSWSPDGTRIAFVSNRDGNDEIYLMNTDGSNPLRLTNNSVFDFAPVWSPDGSRIAFVSSRDFPGITGNIANGFEIYVMNSDGRSPTRLTNNSVSDADPSWSADGSRIAFTTQRDGLPLVYVMNADGSSQTNITQSTTIDSGDPVWSPDGTRIGFTSYSRENNFSNADEIYVISANGSSITRLTHSVLDEHDLAWQPVLAGPTPTPTPAPTPSPSPAITFTISGRVADANGNPIANVTMALLGDQTGTQLTFTDVNGIYSFNYRANHNLTVTPSKSGYSFSPQSSGFVSSRELSGDKTASFTGMQSSAPPAGQIPILLTQEDSLRALAFDSVTRLREPFPVIGIHNFSADQRTRISFFAVNVELGAKENASVITAQAKDSLNRVFPLTIDYVGKVPNFDWLTNVVVELPDDLANSVEVWVSIKMRGSASNQVLINIKPS